MVNIIKRNNLGERVWKWVTMRLSFLWLAFSIFFASYLPIISRYSINAQFNEKGRGYFDFLFVKLWLRRSRESDSWIRLFAIILLACYTLYLVSETLLDFYEEKAKHSFRKITTERYGIENIEQTRLSDKLVSQSASFFSSFCGLLIELWAVISINRARVIGKWVLLKASFCSILIILLINWLFIRGSNEERKETEKKLGFWTIFNNVQKKLIFSELSAVFISFYFFFFPDGSEVTTAVLLGFNISSILNKLRNFILLFPQVFSTYQEWKDMKSMNTKKALFISYDLEFSDDAIAL